MSKLQAGPAQPPHIKHAVNVQGVVWVEGGGLQCHSGLLLQRHALLAPVGLGIKGQHLRGGGEGQGVQAVGWQPSRQGVDSAQLLASSTNAQGRVTSFFQASRQGGTCTGVDAPASPQTHTPRCRRYRPLCSSPPRQLQLAFTTAPMGVRCATWLRSRGSGGS